MTQPLDANEWLTVEAAAKLAGQAVRSWRRRAKEEFERARREGRDARAVKAAPSGYAGKRIWWVRRSLDPRLSPCAGAAPPRLRTRGSLLARYPQHHVDRAYRKSRWLLAWRKLCDECHDRRMTEKKLAVRIVRQARAVEGAGFRISFRSLQFWRKAYNRLGTNGEVVGVEGLIYGSHSGGSGQVSREASRVAPARSAEAIEFFYTLYHTQNRLTVQRCHEETLHIARRRGWSWSASYSATLKWLDVYDNRSITCLMREGRDAWCRRFMPYIEIDYRLIDPGQFYQTDHHQCDFWVRHEGKLLRPWLTVVQDMRSRAIVGWHLGVRAHQDAIIAAYLIAFRDWAIPERMRIDNGKDFVSELLTGVTKLTRNRLRRQYGSDWQRVLRRDAHLVECVDPRFMGITAELGIELVYAVPYAPWSKGTTERWFETFEDRCGKTFTTYCGNSPDTRPECLDTLRRGVDVSTLEEARTTVSAWIGEYHHTAHSAGDMAGRTPLAVWRTAPRLRRANEEELLFLMQARGIYKVGPNGVAFKVGGVRLTYGGGNPALYRFIGRKVLITVNPNDLSRCFAFTADRGCRRFIARLEANQRISPMAGVDELRDAHASIGRQRKLMRRAGYGAATRTRTAVQALRAVRLRKKTGTDEAAVEPTIVPVRTGFERAAKDVQNQNAGETAETGDSTVRDLSAAKVALGFGLGLSHVQTPGRRVSDDLLRGRPAEQAEAVIDESEGRTRKPMHL